MTVRLLVIFALMTPGGNPAKADISRYYLRRLWFRLPMTKPVSRSPRMDGQHSSGKAHPAQRAIRCR